MVTREKREPDAAVVLKHEQQASFVSPHLRTG
jgi:hypothetical protein